MTDDASDAESIFILPMLDPASPTFDVELALVGHAIGQKVTDAFGEWLEHWVNPALELVEDTEGDVEGFRRQLSELLLRTASYLQPRLP